MDKIARQNKIREIISSKSILSQEDLQLELKALGYIVTQATLSRDLKQLRVVKMPDERGELIYTIQDDPASSSAPSLPDHLEGVVSIEFSGQFGVLKTLPGFASAVAYYIDRLKLTEIMGTIAGDDTILIIAREGISKNMLAGTFSNYFKGLKHKIQ
jgi:transcriptional regulator of arginine metabolism